MPSVKMLWNCIFVHDKLLFNRQSCESIILSRLIDDNMCSHSNRKKRLFNTFIKNVQSKVTREREEKKKREQRNKNRIVSEPKKAISDQIVWNVSIKCVDPPLFRIKS